MDQSDQNIIKAHGLKSNVLFGFRDLLHELLSHADLEYSRIDFLRRICTSLLHFSGTDQLSIRIDESGKTTRCRASIIDNGAVQIDAYTPESTALNFDANKSIYDPIPDVVLQAVIKGWIAAPSQFLTRSGSFWIGDTARPILLRETGNFDKKDLSIIIAGEYLSLALILIPISDSSRGYLFLCSRKRDFFSRENIRVYETIAETLGVALSHQKAQWALRERVKELTCLYGIANVASRPGILLEDFLREIVVLLPPAWQYPEITQARISLDGRLFTTPYFQEGPNCQKEEIEINNLKRGSVEVTYLKKMPDFEEGPFLKEERNLINEISRQVGIIVEQWESEQERKKLQEQLRHADRLATVGQLSAGVAHELNEPLAAILGFAQLIKDSQGLPNQTDRDADKIINAALHAREVIQKLMIFTRQMPARKALLNLSQLVKESLYFLESRCEKEGIVMIRRLDDDLPQIFADPSQIYQVLVNLVVNAIQAMPNGGRLTISTSKDAGFVCLVVEDTGVGISPDVQKHLFVPFFTTKDVGQGTGLGLAVVHGIVMDHGGTVHVKSQLSQGSSFEVRLPIKNVTDSTERG